MRSPILVIGFFSLLTIAFIAFRSTQIAFDTRYDVLSAIVQNKYTGLVYADNPSGAVGSNDFFTVVGLGETGELFVVDSLFRQTSDTRFFAKGTTRDFTEGLLKSGKKTVIAEAGSTLMAWTSYEDYKVVATITRGEVLEAQVGLLCAILVVAGLGVIAMISSLSSIRKISKSIANRQGVQARGDLLLAMLDESCLVSITDEHGDIVYANHKFCETSGYDAHELYGKNHRMLSSGSHPPELWKVMYSNTSFHNQIWHHGIENRKKNGELYVVRAWVKAMFNKDGDLEGWISVQQDVSELISGRDIIESKNIILERTAYLGRHDMRSPITIYLRRAVDAIKRKHGKENSDFRFLYQASEEVFRVYDSFYDFSNLMKPGGGLEKEFISVKEVVKAATKASVYGPNVLFDDNLGTIFVNSSTFGSAIDNLVRNSFRYNDSPSKIIRIYREEDSIVIQDNGRGMTPAEFKEYSHPWKRGDNGETGSGLGLVIASTILDKHGFELTCVDIDSGCKLKINNVYT